MKIHRVVNYIILAILIFAVNAAPADEIKAKVVWVHDGDSFVVQNEAGRAEVRLFGVDAPEKGQPYSRQALKFMIATAKNKVVTIEVVDKDAYGRFVAWVRLSDGRLLNHLVVEQGWAWHFVRYAPDDEILARLEREAKEDRRGLWKDRNPIPPWEYRRRN